MRKRIVLVLSLILTTFIAYLNVSLYGLLDSMPAESTSKGSLFTSPLRARLPWRLALVVEGEDQHFWELVKEGAADAALSESTGSSGERAVYVRVFQSTAQSQLQLKESLRFATLAGYDGIIVHAEDEGAVSSIREAVETGIPVIVVASDLPGSGRISYVGTNNYRAGFAAGKTVLRALFSSGSASTTGPFAVLSAVSGNDRQMSAAESLKVFGFREAISSAGNGEPPIWRQCKPTILDSTAAVRQLFADHPDIQGIYITHAAGTLAAAKVVSQEQLNHPVVIVGTGDSAEIREHIRAGTITATIVEYPYQIGFTAIKEMLLYLREGRVNVYNNIDGLLLTRDNIDAYR